MTFLSITFDDISKDQLRIGAMRTGSGVTVQIDIDKPVPRYFWYPSPLDESHGEPKFTGDVNVGNNHMVDKWGPRMSTAIMIDSLDFIDYRQDCHRSMTENKYHDDGCYNQVDVLVGCHALDAGKKITAEIIFHVFDIYVDFDEAVRMLKARLKLGGIYSLKSMQFSINPPGGPIVTFINPELTPLSDNVCEELASLFDQADDEADEPE